MKNLLVSLLLVAFFIFIGTYAYHSLEGWTWVDSAYYATVTLTNGGGGNLFLKTNEAKLFSIVYIIIGLSSVIYALTNVSKYHTPKITRRIEKTLDLLNREKKP